MFKILHGGRIRQSGVTGAAEAWSRGQAIYAKVTANSDGFTLALYDGTQTVLVGPALESCVAAGGNGLANADTVVAGGVGSFLLDNAIVETDKIVTGITFAVGDDVHASSATGQKGNYTNIQGSGSPSAFVGWCVRKSATNADASGSTTFRFLYLPPRWTF